MLQVKGLITQRLLTLLIAKNLIPLVMHLGNDSRFNGGIICPVTVVVGESELTIHFS